MQVDFARVTRGGEEYKSASTPPNLTAPPSPAAGGGEVSFGETVFMRALSSV
jgi:hypothetical protein